MDSFLSKLGLYDFMGIWGPGAITVTYFAFTLFEPIDALRQKAGILNPGFSEAYLVVILYTVVAYTVGVTLHGIGDFVGMLIGIYKNTNSKSSEENSEEKWYKGIIELIGKNLEDGTQNSNSDQESVGEKEGRTGSKSIAEMVDELKYDKNINTKRIDTFEAVYAMARSLSFCFILHFIAYVVLWLMGCFRPTSIILIGIDLVLGMMFALRAYKHWIAWKNTVTRQYQIHYKDNTKAKID